MRVQIRMRFLCSSGRKCASAKTIGTELFDDWVDATIVGEGNRIMLDSLVPPGWTTRTMEGSGEHEPVCPACKESL